MCRPPDSHREHDNERDHLKRRVPPVRSLSNVQHTSDGIGNVPTTLECSMSRIAIIGAGPIGLEAAFLARQLGHEVQVFEKGRVAENVLDWGHARLFSPFDMNSSEWGRGALTKLFGSSSLPRDGELLTGHEFADRYLLPLSQLPEFVGRIHERCQVLSISRRHFRKIEGEWLKGRLT